MEEKPVWPPDWKRVNLYPDPVKTSMNQWAWEFLRRNEDYLMDCESLGVFSEEGNIIFSGNLSSDDEDLVPTPFGEREFQSIKITEKYGLFFHLCHPSTSFDNLPPGPVFGISCYPEIDLFNEEKHDWRIGNREKIDEIGMLLWSGIGKPLIPTNPQEVVVKFDLRLRLDDQLKYVKKILLEEQKKIQISENQPRTAGTQKLCGKDAQNFLRVIDGTNQGATQLTIGEIVYPESLEPAGLVQKNLKKARKYVYGDYKNLVLL